MITTLDVQEATAALRHEWYKKIESPKGARCVVCDRYGKIYSIKLTGSMVRSLVWLYDEQTRHRVKWVNVPENAPKHVFRAYSLTSLKHWGLVAPMPKAEKSAPVDTPENTQIKKPQTVKTKTSGNWRVTVIGEEFLRGTTKMPDRVFVYNDLRVGASDTLLSARECLARKFNYEELLADSFARPLLYKD
jgi:hypothetical protein